MCCPNCGHDTRAGGSRCHHCNFKLPETLVPQESGRLALRHCWNCAQANPFEATRCVQCNARFEQSAPHTASSRQIMNSHDHE